MYERNARWANGHVSFVWFWLSCGGRSATSLPWAAIPTVYNVREQCQPVQYTSHARSYTRTRSWCTRLREKGRGGNDIWRRRKCLKEHASRVAVPSPQDRLPECEASARACTAECAGPVESGRLRHRNCTSGESRSMSGESLPEEMSCTLCDSVCWWCKRAGTHHAHAHHDVSCTGLMSARFGCAIRVTVLRVHARATL